jgi:hypothetical protein
MGCRFGLHRQYTVTFDFVGVWLNQRVFSETQQQRGAL